MKEIQLNVIKNIQKHRQVVYLGYLTKQQANIVSFSDFYPPTKAKIGYQRPPEKKRAQDFSKYIESDRAGFITPILLNSRVKLKYEEYPNTRGFGFITLPAKECLAIVDGQHRALGIINYLDQDIPIPFMLFDNLNVDLEQELFVRINREQKKVSMSHVKFIGRKDDPLSELAVKLESDPNSPWYHRVNLVGARGTKRPVSLQSLRSALEELLQSGEVKVMSFDEKYRIAAQFWGVVSEVWKSAWEAQKNSLLKKSMGTLALSKLGGYIIPQCLEVIDGKMHLNTNKLKSYLERAAEVNWMSDGDFKGFSGRHGADLVKNHLDSLIFSKVGQA